MLGSGCRAFLLPPTATFSRPFRLNRHSFPHIPAYASRPFHPMLLSSSPRKQVPLNSGDDDWESGPSSRPATVTKRVFFCGVVVENDDGVELSEGAHCHMLNKYSITHISLDVRELIASFGDPVQIDDPSETNDENASSIASTDQVGHWRSDSIFVKC